MRDRWLLAMYLATVLLMSLLQDVRALSASLIVIAALCGRDLWRIARRAILATAFFTTLVSGLWLLSAWRLGDIPWAAVLRLNLRVLVLTASGFLAADRIRLDRALSATPRLAALAVLIRSQQRVFIRLLADQRLAVRSRCCRRLGWRDRRRVNAAAVAAVLQRTEFASRDLTQGMVARGFFLDSH